MKFSLHYGTWCLALTMALGGKFCISAHGCTLCKHTLPQLFCCEGFEFVSILLFQCWLIFLERTMLFLSNTNGFLKDKITRIFRDIHFMT